MYSIAEYHRKNFRITAHKMGKFITELNLDKKHKLSYGSNLAKYKAKLKSANRIIEGTY